MKELPIRAGRIGLPLSEDSNSIAWVSEEEIRQIERFHGRCMVTFSTPHSVENSDSSNVFYFHERTVYATVDEVLSACEKVRTGLRSPVDEDSQIKSLKATCRLMSIHIAELYAKLDEQAKYAIKDTGGEIMASINNIATAEEIERRRRVSAERLASTTIAPLHVGCACPDACPERDRPEMDSIPSRSDKDSDQ